MSVRTISLSAFAVTSLLWAACGGEGPPPGQDLEPAPAPVDLRPPIQRDELSVIVRFADNERARSPAQREQTLARVGGTFLDIDNDGVYDAFAHVEPRGLLAKVDLEGAMSVDQALEALRADPAVAYAEPNVLVQVASAPSPATATAATATATATGTAISAAGSPPNDSRFATQWALHNTGQTGGTPDADIDAPEAWAISPGSADVVVGVIDSGIDYRHPDLSANLWINPREIAGNNLDDDGNGVIDDVYGYDAVADDGDPMDDNSHGTQCAGIIGAQSGNGRGVSGVARRVSLMALKFIDAQGNGTLANAIEAIDYAVAQKRAGVNLRVLSNSWVTSSASAALKEAIEVAGNEGILFVAAAGNYGADLERYAVYPAGFDSPNILSVAATDHVDGLASFSNYGARSVDLGAPGQSTPSTALNASYRAFVGSSMAAPHVAGAAALVASVNPDMAAKYIKDLLMTSGDPLASLAGRTVSGRRLNVARALAGAGPVVPSFGLGLEATTLPVSAGDAAEWWVDIDSVGGFGGAVAMSAQAGQPFDGTLAFETSPVAAPGRAKLRVTTTPATQPGLYAVTITGQSGSSARSRRLLLKVRPPGVIEEEGHSSDVPTPVPQSDPAGLRSTIEIKRSFALRYARVELAMSKDQSRDLLITLRSPSGATLELQRAQNEVRPTYAIPAELVGTQSAGAWTLTVTDLGGGMGEQVFDGWSLTLVNTESPGSFDLVVPYADYRVIPQRDGYSYRVDVPLLDGYFAPVYLSLEVPQEIPGATLELTSTEASFPGSVGVVLITSCATPAGSYTFYVKAESKGVIKRVPLVARVIGSGGVSFAEGPRDRAKMIPDGTADGAVSELSFPLLTWELGYVAVELDITHPKIDELTIEAIAPWGAVVTLHDRTGAGQHDLHRIYEIPSFVGYDAFGTWKLRVVDHSRRNRGSLNWWKLNTFDTRLAPWVVFGWSSLPNHTMQFTDHSSDSDGTCGAPLGDIASWRWEFGDGETSTLQHPTHAYAAPGIYKVTLTVTDNENNERKRMRDVEVR